MIVVVGAGISGLTSALTLRNLGHQVLILEKSQSVGGRMATRYFDERGIRRYVDTASRYIDLDSYSPRFNELLRSHLSDSCQADRCYGERGINGICQEIASLLPAVDTLTNHRTTKISYDKSKGKFSIMARAAGETKSIEADGIILTAPVPQSMDLIGPFQQLLSDLGRAPKYHRALVLLLWPNHPIEVCVLRQSPKIHRISRQDHIKQNSEPVPIVVHATYKWSNQHYGLPDGEVETLFIEELGIMRSDYDQIQVKRWVRPRSTDQHTVSLQIRDTLSRKLMAHIGRAI